MSNPESPQAEETKQPETLSEIDTSGLTEEGQGLYDYFRQLEAGGEQEQTSEAPPPETEAAGAEGSEEPGSESDLRAFFTGEDGSLDSEKMLGAFETTRELHRQMNEHYSKLYAQNEEFRRREAAMAAEAQTAGIEGERPAAEAAEPARIQPDPGRPMLPEDHDGTLDQTAVDLIVDGVYTKLRNEGQATIQQQQQQQYEERYSQASARINEFSTRTRGNAEAFARLHGLTRDVMEEVDELMNEDEELNAAAEAFLYGQIDYPEDFIESRRREAYNFLMDWKRQEQGPDEQERIERAVEEELRRRGLNESQVQQSGIESVSRRSEIPIAGNGADADAPKDVDAVDRYYMNSEFDPDPAVRDLLRILGESVPAH